MVKLLRCARGLYGSRRSSGSGWWRRAAFCFLNNSFTAQSCSIHTTASYCTGGSAFTSDDDGKWCSWNYNKQFFVSSSIILLFDDRQWANCPKNDFLWTLMSESCHAQLRKVLPLLLLLLSSPSPSIPLKWYFIVLAVSADTADTHVTNAASMLDNGNNWMPIYVKYNWDFIEIMPLIRLDSAACKVKSVLCHLFVIFLQQFVSDAKLRPSLMSVRTSGLRKQQQNSLCHSLSVQNRFCQTHLYICT